MSKNNIKNLDVVFHNSLHSCFCILGALVLLIAVMVPGVDAGEGCACAGGCAVGNWDPSAFLSSDVPGYDNADNSTSPAASATSEDVQSAPEPEYRSDLFTNGQIMKPLQSVASSDIIIDASNGDSYSKSHIKGAIHISSLSFLDDNGSLKSAQELAGILGAAGVSITDPIVVYGDDFSSGDATLVFWALKYLGQEDVKVLDVSLEDWKAANLPVESTQKTRPAVTYTPSPRSDIIAEYDYVKSSEAQIIDARPFAEFGKGRISGAISLDPAKVLYDDKITDESELAGLFSSLSKDKPVVVYSNDYNQASVVGYALELMGYNAEMYTWSDWTEHQPASESDKDASHYMKLGKA